MNRISATDTLHAAPENALVYSILSNADAVRHLSDGSFDPPKLTWVVLKSDGSSPTRLETLDACTAEGLTLKYKRNTDEAALEIEESMSHTLTEGMTDIALYVYKGGIRVAEKVVKVVYDGPQGPGYYPAGSYNDKTTYKWNGVKMVPVVECGGLYYALQETEATKAGIKGINPKTDVANNGGNWEVFDMFKWLMSEVAFINFGKLASAIFYGQYMFSQYGTDASGASVETADGYKDFNYSDPMNKSNSFRPNILLDFLRGKAWLKDADIAGSVTLRSLKRRIVRNGTDSYLSLNDSSGFYLDGDYSMPVLSDDCSMDLHAMVLEPSSRSIHGYGKIFFPSSNNVVFYNGQEHVAVRYLEYAHSGGFIKAQFYGVSGENGCNNWYVGVESDSSFAFTVELYP